MTTDNNSNWSPPPPELDKYNYPSDEILEAIEFWEGSIKDLLDYVAECWHWPDFGVSHSPTESELNVINADPEDKFLRLATGGWSGNEDLVYALKRHWCSPWVLSARGGLHIFKYNDLVCGPSPLKKAGR